MIVLLFALLAVANALPEQVHLAFYGTNGMSVGWYTANQTQTSVVKYGLAANALTSTVQGGAVNYGAPGYHHFVVMSDLQPATTYYYSCGDSVDGFSTVYSFVTARAPGDTTPFVIGILGDMGITNSEGTTQGMIASLNHTDFFWHVGDFAYADDRLEMNYEQTFNQFMNQIQPIASTKAYMTAPGNHEATCNEVVPFFCSHVHRNFTTYRNRFLMPYTPSRAVNNMWYSFDYGLVHFVVISTETDFDGAPEGAGSYLNGGPFGDQLTWLHEDLQAAVLNRDRVPWIIVGGHRPIYTVNGATAAVTNTFEPIFRKYNVDMYFCGHVHWYERLWPVYQGKVLQKDYNEPQSTVYIINGGAGNIEGHNGGDNVQDYLAYLNKADFGSGQLIVYNSTTVKWQFFRGTDHGLDDEIVVVKTKH